MPIISRLTDGIAPAALRESLDGLSARQKAIANNIANVDTPGYKRNYVSFETELRRVLDKGNKREVLQGMRELEHARMTDLYSPARPDGNNVNIDAEVSALAKTSLQFKASVTLLDLRGSIIRAAVEGR